MISTPAKSKLFVFEFLQGFILQINVFFKSQDNTNHQRYFYTEQVSFSGVTLEDNGVDPVMIFHLKKNQHRTIY